jgi:hypothetical protein
VLVLLESEYDDSLLLLYCIVGSYFIRIDRENHEICVSYNFRADFAGAAAQSSRQSAPHCILVVY